MPNSRVVIDTNVWISFLIGKQLQGLRRLLTQQTITVLVAAELLAELSEVVQRPKLAHYFSPSKTQELLIYLRLQGEVVPISSTVAVCRDPKDNFLLALARDRQADLLVTGDQDLLVLAAFEQTRIVAPAAFELLFQAA